MPNFRFSALIAAALGAALFLLACGGADDAPQHSGAASTPRIDAGQFKPSSDPARTIPKDQLGAVNVVVAGSDWYVGTNNFVFGITNKKDEPQGGAKAIATFYDLKDPKNPVAVFQREAVPSAPGVHPVTEHVHPGGVVHQHGGENDDRVGYYVTMNFDHPGAWGLLVQATLKDGTQGAASILIPNVTEKPAIPAAGEAAPKSDNLTKDDVSNIKEIDSGDPPNDMHTVKIKDAWGKRPMVVVFSTPAFCTSRFCGPVNEEVEDLQTAYRDKVDFIHIEIWRDFDKQQLNPTAREWLLRADGSLMEPTVYVIDAKGTIYDRWEGPVARNIMEPAVKAVAEGKLFGQ